MVLGVIVISGAGWAGKTFLWNPKHSAASVAGAGAFRPQRIAVLYFTDQSPDGRLGYLADGLTESMVDQLGQVAALDVVSKGGVTQFRGKDVAIDSIARTLEAGTLVDGSITPEGNNVRITMRLLDGNTGAQIDRLQRHYSGAILARHKASSLRATHRREPRRTSA